MTHELKILPEYFDEMLHGRKRFEIRKDDRGFEVGDRIMFREWDGKQYTGKRLYRYISYILRDFPDGLKDGYCILSMTNSAYPSATLD